jgi:mannose-6-phosphate isomerase-like protein (cupin superfamily)
MKKNEALSNFFTRLTKPKTFVAASISSFMMVWLLSSSLNAQQPAPEASQRPPQPTGQAKEGVTPLNTRIGHSDLAKAMPGKNVHQGTGTVGMQTLLGRGAVKNLAFMHHGPLGAKSSIGHHFHTNSDEMFLILDGDCQFTVNGQTALIKGPVGVPCKAGNSHAVYNPSAKAVDWVNFQVLIADPVQPSAGAAPAYGAGAPPQGPGAPRVQSPGAPPAQGGAGMMRRSSYNYSADPTNLFEMGDDRSDAVLVKKPTFINTGQLTKENLRAVVNMNGGKDTVFYRRALGPGAFESNWAFFDHLLIPVGSTVGRHYHAGVDEVYLVIKGKGKVHVNDEVADLVYGDAVPVKAGEIHSFESSATEPLELVIYGIAIEKGKLDVVDVPLTMAKLQMFFEVLPENYAAFEKNYIDVYVPALRRQVGYLGSKLLRIFPAEVTKKNGSPESKFTFQMELMFEKEEQRVAWTKTKEHDDAWNHTVAFAKSYQWLGYDVVGMDQVADPLGKRNITSEKQ